MKAQFLKHFVVVSLLAAACSVVGAAPAAAAKKVVTLRHSPEFILKAILQHKALEFRPDVPMPEVVVASTANLRTFQDDVEPQWGMRPTVVTNVFVVSKNKIYVSDEKAYYDKTARCMDDSLAHELAHYIQVKYRGWSLDDDSLEWDAIDTQTWFRDTHCAPLKS